MNEYPWAPHIAAALLETNAQNLKIRIAIAERAISERLANNPAIDSQERLRIRDAQYSLNCLKRELKVAC